VQNSGHHALFDSLDVHGTGQVSITTFLRTMREAGISIDDIRMADTKKYLETLTEDSFDYETFKHAISSSYALVEKALTRKLVIPDWAHFCETLTDLYKQTKKMSGGKVADYIPELGNKNQLHLSVII
jgi:glutaminase